MAWADYRFKVDWENDNSFGHAPSYISKYVAAGPSDEAGVTRQPSLVEARPERSPYRC